MLNVTVNKPQRKDLKAIEKILTQWTAKQEKNIYLQRISNEIAHHTEFNMHFWVAKDGNKTIGIIGLCDPLPKILSLAKTNKPGEIKILHVNKNQQKKGVGKILITFIEKQAKNQGYSELLVRSAERYKDSAWGFYERLGYLKIGTVTGGKNSKFMQVFHKKL